MLTSTRAVVATGPGKLEMRTYPLPEIGDEDGILKVELAGVCGSDPGIFKGKSARAPRPWPIILGHEIVGRVHRMGKAAQQRHGVKEGDRVIIEYAFGCGMCKPCLTGRYTLCERFYNYGSMISCASPPHLFGAYADYLYIHPRAMVHKIGEDLSPEEGVLICAVVGNGVRWLRHIGGVTIGQPVAIVGPGQQGLAAVAVAKEAGVLFVPIACSGGRVITLRKAWDRTMLPLPFSTMVIDVGEPVEVPPDADAAAMEELRRRVEETLNRMTDALDRHCGYGPPDA